jgi:AAA domain
MTTMQERPRSAVPYSEIPHLPRRWQGWDEYLPVGGVVVFAAAGGTGKGMLMCAAAARLVLGLPFPGDDPEARRAPMRVLWIVGAGEDDQFEDLAPRLRAAIAAATIEFGLDPATAARAIGLVCDLSEWEPGGEPVTLPADCGRLAAEIETMNADGGPPVGLVVADSLSALLSEGFTVDSRQGARRVMGRLSRCARAADVPLALLHHLTKDGKVAGSPAVLDAVRLAFRIETDKDRPTVRTIIPHKANSSGAPPQQYLITGENPNTVAVFVKGSSAREERVSRHAAYAAAAPSLPQHDRSSRRARMEAAAPPQRSADGLIQPTMGGLARPPQESYRVLRKEGSGPVSPVGPGHATRHDARCAAERDAGRSLDWEAGQHAGHDVAGVRMPDGVVRGYLVSPVSAASSAAQHS